MIALVCIVARLATEVALLGPVATALLSATASTTSLSGWRKRGRDLLGILKARGLVLTGTLLPFPDEVAINTL